MNRVFVVFLVFVVGAGLLSLACGTATPTAIKVTGVDTSAPAATLAPTATLLAEAPMETSAPTDTPTPATVLPLTVPSFQEMLATNENETLTSVQKRNYNKKLVGERVVDWQGVVSDAGRFLGTSMINVDLPGGMDNDILFVVSREELANFNKQQAITLSGRIERVYTTFGSFSLTLEDVTYELGAVPPTNTPPPTRTPRPTSTSRPTDIIAPTETAGPTNTAAVPSGAGTSTAKSTANLRAGPGLNFAVVGGVPAGTVLEIVARTSAGDWYLLSSGTWIAAQLVNGAPDVPVAEVIPTPKALPPSTMEPTRPSSVASSFGNGTWIVGADITPGTYRSAGGSNCYWERLKGFGGTLDEIIANDNASGPTIVTIAATDKGFSSARCNRWTADLSPITSGPTAPFGEGTLLLNKDIAPGTWRSSGSGDCYWQRLRGFSGELDDIIANDNVSGPTVVTISPDDAGFSSARCGTWSKIQ